MKILTAQQIREADRHTIENQPIMSIDLMERAAKAFVDWYTKIYSPNMKILTICGLGNNGGDGLAISRLLINKGYNVETFIIDYSEKKSPDFQQNLKKLYEISENSIHWINNPEHFPVINKGDRIIDALFGTGLNRPLEDLPAEIVNHINRSGGEITSVDIPSGLHTDKPSESETIVQAKYTVTFELPKFSFLLPETYIYVGDWVVVPIGLDSDFIAVQKTQNYYLERQQIKHIIKKYPRKKYDHKGTFGHALLISGSYGKMGAALLCTQACLRSGAGLATVYTPKIGYSILQTTVPEAMVVTDKQENYISSICETHVYPAVGVGPGLGYEDATQEAIIKLISSSEKPMVLDADALNILSLNKESISHIPKNSILTPHPKEFSRLVGDFNNDFERYEAQKSFSISNGLYVVLKGAHTTITTPSGDVFFNSTGNPGLAKGGTGDILTGLLTGLLAQGFDSLDAALVGVYVHGLAGDITAGNLGERAMTAYDVITNFSKAFASLT